jgi:hypothetical protein
MAGDTAFAVTTAVEPRQKNRCSFSVFGDLVLNNCDLGAVHHQLRSLIS